MSFAPVTCINLDKECIACSEAFEPNDDVLSHNGIHDIHLVCIQQIREQRLNHTPTCPICHEKITSVQIIRDGKLIEVPLPTAAPIDEDPLAQDEIDRIQERDSQDAINELLNQDAINGLFEQQYQMAQWVDDVPDELGLMFALASPRIPNQQITWIDDFGRRVRLCPINDAQGNTVGWDEKID